MLDFATSIVHHTCSSDCFISVCRWPEYFCVSEGPSGDVMGYIMGKSEARQNNPVDWHGHVTAVTISPDYRRLGLAATLMSFLEEVSDIKKCLFVDLFVRMTNTVAVNMYNNMGYVVYRKIPKYYSGPPDEDAYDMRKALSSDVDKSSEKPCTDPDLPLEAS